MTLDELWPIARQYGRVRLSTLSDGEYYATIEFNTTAHVKLEAKSSMDHKTPQGALKQAITEAQTIVDSVSKGVDSFKRISV